MSAPQLGIDPEDLGLDILPAIEKSFGISFDQNDFHKDFTYGELYALVLAKLPTATAADCTIQQAFYKLRQALMLLTGATKISPSTRLDTLLPADPRPAAAHLAASLAIKLNLVAMPKWAEVAGSILLLSATGLLPVVILAAVMGGETWGAPATLLLLSCFGLSVLIFTLGVQIGKRLAYETVGELAIHMSSQHYRQSRRNPDTVNLREISSQLERIFIDMAGLEAAELVPDAIL